MSDYTPTTEAIRGRIIQRGIGWGFYGLDEFDRWLATHDAEKRAEWEAEQGETEYGATNVDDDRPVSIRDTLAEAVEAQKFYTRDRGRKTHLFMRTKAIPAGPWLPVPDTTNNESEGKA